MQLDQALLQLENLDDGHMDIIPPDVREELNLMQWNEVGLGIILFRPHPSMLPNDSATLMRATVAAPAINLMVLVETVTGRGCMPQFDRNSFAEVTHLPSHDFALRYPNHFSV